MTTVVDNNAYSITNISGKDVQVPVGKKVDYIYDDEGGIIYLLGYNAVNYHEYISKSLMSLSKSIVNISSINSVDAITNIGIAKDTAITDIKTSTDTLKNAVLETAKEAVYNSIDGIEDSIEKMEKKVGDSADGIKAINTKIGEIEGQSGVFYDIKQLQNDISDEGEGLGKKLKDLTETVGVLPYFGVYSPDDDVNVKGVIPSIKSNKADIINIQTDVGKIHDEIYKQPDGLDQTIKTNRADFDDLYAQVNGQTDDETSGILDKIEDINKKLSSIPGFSDETFNNIQTDVNTLSNIINDVDGKIGLKTEVSTNKANITQLQLDVGSSDKNTGIFKKIDTIETSIGTSTTSGILKDLQDLKDLDLTAVATAVTGDNGLVTKMTNFETDTITPTIEGVLTYDNVYYNGKKIKETFDDLSIDDLETAKNQFNSYFLDDEGKYIGVDTIGETPLNNWLDDTSSSGFVEITKSLVQYSGEFVALQSKVSNLQTDVGNSTSDEKTGIFLKINDIEDSIGTSTTSGILKDLQDLKDLNLSDLNTTVNGDDGLVTKMGNFKTINDNIDAISTTSFKRLKEVNREIDNINQEAMKYLTVMPWIRDILMKIIDGSITSSDLETDFNNKIDTIKRILIVPNTNDTFISINEDGSFTISISLDADTKFDDTHFVLTYYDADDVVYFKKYELSNSELASGEVIREVNDIVLSNSDGDIINVSDSTSMYKYDVNFVYGLYNVVLDEPIDSTGKSSDYADA